MRHRPATLAERAGADFQKILSSYAIGRFLYRLSVSKHRKDFVLKEATLFTLWEGFQHRQTRDVDGYGDKSIERLIEVFKKSSPPLFPMTG